MEGEDGKRLAELVKAGRKIEAIKLVRELTGCGLAEGKAAVERLEQELAGQAPAAWPSVELPTEQIKALVREGNLIGAIKAYREATGCGLKEAKDAVDRIAAEL